ncbi:hypothetical protein D3C76_689260 [compost metagenome]
MPAWVTPVHRVAAAIAVWVDACSFRVQFVRAVETHQYRVVGAVATPQQVPAKGSLAGFAIEAEQTLQVAVGEVFAVGIVTGLLERAAIAFGDHATDMVGQQQPGAAGSTRLLQPRRVVCGIQVLGEQPVFHCAAQAVALIASLHFTGVALRRTDQIAVAVVTVAVQ